MDSLDKPVMSAIMETSKELDLTTETQNRMKGLRLNLGGIESPKNRGVNFNDVRIILDSEQIGDSMNSSIDYNPDAWKIGDCDQTVKVNIGYESKQSLLNLDHVVGKDAGFT